MHLPVTHISMIIVLALMLIGCRPTGQLLETLVAVSQRVNERMVEHVPSLPAHPLYVLAVSVDAYNENELVIVDKETWQVARRAPLLAADPWTLSQDPQGRIWVSYGAAPGLERRVQVLTPDGTVLKTFSPCITPYLPVHFAAERAFISCLENGFHAAVVVVDLTSLEIVEQVAIRTSTDAFLLVGVAGDENYLALAGVGKVSNRVVLLDTHTLATLDPLPIPDSNPIPVLAHQGKFLILNSIAGSLLDNNMVKPLPAGRPDLLIIDPTPIPTLTTQQMVAPGVLWGTIVDDTLYAYHNAERWGFSPDARRGVSRLNLNTNEAELWPLPDGWNAKDIAVIDGEILLTYSSSLEVAKSGLYRFDPATDQLTLVLNIPGAERLLLGK